MIKSISIFLERIKIKCELFFKKDDKIHLKNKSQMIEINCMNLV